MITGHHDRSDGPGEGDAPQGLKIHKRDGHPSQRGPQTG